MGTQRQATALVNLVNSIGRKQLLGELSPEKVAEYTAKILAMPLSGVQEEFRRLNAITGFTRNDSPATGAQRTRLAQLEIAHYGKRQTTWVDAMTFAQAYDKIAALAALRSGTKTGIRSLEELANSKPARSQSPQNAS